MAKVIPIRPRRYYGEEAQKLTNAEQAAFNARMARYASGEEDILACLEEAPDMGKVRVSLRD